MTALTAAYAYFIGGGVWKKLILFVSAIPLAIAGNIARVMSIAVVARFAGQEKAIHYYHDYSGYLIFAVAVILMLTLEKAMTGAWQKNTVTPDKRRAGHHPRSSAPL